MAPALATAPAALSLEHVAKRFGRVEALGDASLHVRPGTVHALLGENGAGKTTLMRIAFGELRPDAGSIRIHGQRVEPASPSAALARGLGMVHQHFTAVPAMTVAENVALASGMRGRFDPVRARERVLELSREVGLPLDPDARAADLGVGMQQRLEIVKALSRGARVLILDEPTAVLAPAEAEELLAMLRRFAARGNSAVMITHKLREALSVADDVTVLHHGRTTLSAPRSEVDSAMLATAMIGSGEVGPPPRAAAPPVQEREVVIDARDVVIADDNGAVRVKGATLRIHAGEIVGVAGVEGAGQHELLRALAGRRVPTAGSLCIPERIGFVPEDRQRDALVLDFTLAENVALAGSGSARGRMNWPAIEHRTGELLARYDIVAGGARALASSLSGGNQQKIVLARELDGAPLALVVENPTRGLDIAATAALQRHLTEARDSGMAVVVYSSDLDEVLALADRLYVMYDGRSREVALDRAVAGRAMLGAE